MKKQAKKKVAKKKSTVSPKYNIKLKPKLNVQLYKPKPTAPPGTRIPGYYTKESGKKNG